MTRAATLPVRRGSWYEGEEEETLAAREAKDPERSIASAGASELSEPPATARLPDQALLPCPCQFVVLTVHLLPPFSASGWTRLMRGI